MRDDLLRIVSLYTSEARARLHHLRELDEILEMAFRHLRKGNSDHIDEERHHLEELQLQISRSNYEISRLLDEAARISARNRSDVKALFISESPDLYSLIESAETIETSLSRKYDEVITLLSEEMETTASVIKQLSNVSRIAEDIDAKDP